MSRKKNIDQDAAYIRAPRTKAVLRKSAHELAILLAAARKYWMTQGGAR